jgi:hypothetical protein
MTNLRRIISLLEAQMVAYNPLLHILRHIKVTLEATPLFLAMQALRITRMPTKHLIPPRNHNPHM